MSSEDEIVRHCFTIAQRAIDDLRRYCFDDTPDRRVKRAERFQADIEALASRLGYDHGRYWPRQMWMTDAATASFAVLDAKAKGALNRIDAAQDEPLGPYALGAMASGKEAIGALIEDARDMRHAMRQLETDLEWEECESSHWATKAALNGDLGANPPTFLVDVVADQAREIAELKERIRRLEAGH